MTSSPDLTQSKPAVPGGAPAEYMRFFEALAPFFVLPPSFLDLLIPSDTTEIETAKLGKALAEISREAQRFYEWIRKAREEEKGALTEDALIRGHGMDNTRYFVFSALLSEQVLGKPFQWQNGRPKTDPKQLLRHAAKAELAYGGREIRLAFAGGLVYDILGLAAMRLGETPRATLDFIADMAGTGLKTARIGVALSRRIQDLRLANYVYSLCLLHGVGPVTLSLLKPDYLRYVLRTEKDKLPHSVRLVCEDELFAVSPDALGSLICRLLPPFEPMVEALHHCRQPYRLKLAGKTELYNLAAVCCLASNIATRPLSPQDAEDPKIAQFWLTPELGAPILNGQQICSVLETLSSG